MMAEIQRQITVSDPIGLHARPVGEIIRLVKSSGIRVSVSRPGESPQPVESPLRLLAMKVKSGEMLQFWFFDTDSEVVDRMEQEIQVLLAGG
ncbi:MAG: hypothetical protein RL198_550 [Actinomycetota bacterium]